MICTQRIDTRGRILLIILGEPVAKPRMTQRDKWKQRPDVMRYRAWCDFVRIVAGKIPDANLVEAVNWTAWFKLPASWSRKARAAAIETPHRQRPDKDNLDKGVLDTLWKEDAAIYRGSQAKYWGEEPRIEIEIVLSQEQEAQDAVL